MLKIEEFAEKHMGIKLLPKQLEIIEMVINAPKYTVFSVGLHRRSGITTANNVIREYLRYSMTEVNSIEDRLMSLSEVELKVIGILHMSDNNDFGYGYCYHRHADILSGSYNGDIESIDDEVGGKKGLSKVLKHLRELDLVKFATGLLTEDGEVAGAGHAPNEKYEAAFEKLCIDKGWL